MVRQIQRTIVSSIERGIHSAQSSHMNLYELASINQSAQ
jgi:hypothetical protein